MADTRIYGSIAPSNHEVYVVAILIPEIVANNFELKHGLINLVQNKQFFGHDKEDPHAHIRYFNKITSTMRVPNVPIATIKLMLFPISIEGAVPEPNRLRKEPLRSIQTWDDLVELFGQKARECFKNHSRESSNFKVRQTRARQLLPDIEEQASAPDPAPAPVKQDVFRRISFTDALVLMPKFASTLRTLLGNKEKLTEVARTSNEPCLARTSMNEHCSAVILNKLPRKLGDPGKFLIPCEFPGMDECLALADLGASINLMPFSVWEKLSLPDLNPTCMTLELADRSISKPMGIAKDISVKVGVFHFPADFVVVDFEPDPRVPLILGRCFLKTSRALIDVHKGELTLRIGSEAITYNLDQTSRYSANYTHMTANKIDVIDMACEEYSQEVLGFTNIIADVEFHPYL
ncbi:reverse transcriptase domain-containing protein [Tanacetum coccineum]